MVSYYDRIIWRQYVFMERNHSLKPAAMRLGIAAALLAATGLFLHLRKPPEGLYDVTRVEATCTDPGYSLYTNREDGSTYVDDIVPAPGHSWSQWTSLTEAAGVQPGSEGRKCSVCGSEEEQVRYPQLGIPVIALEGDLNGIGKTTEVPVTAELIGAEKAFSAWATVKYQGHESLRYDKKNYTLKLYRDEDRDEKYKMTFSHWQEEHKYILKANYVDPSHCRNQVCADVWAQIAAERSSLPAQMRSLSNYGAVDSFPVALYINREFRGLYSWTLHKDDDLFGMKKGAQQAILIANDASAPEAYFREEAAFAEDSPWEVEFCGTEDQSWAKEKLNALIDFVNGSDDEAFRKGLKKHLDVDSAIDYYLSIYALGLTNHEAANLVLVCYGKDQPFTASLFSMNTAFGLSADGTEVRAPEEFLPGEKTGNLLWDRLAECFRPEIEARYASLREGILEPEALCRRVTECAAAIPAAVTEADAECFPWPNPEISHVEQMKQYIVRRAELLDTIFLTGESD